MVNSLQFVCFLTETEAIEKENYLQCISYMRIIKTETARMSCFCYVNKTFLIYMQLLKKSQQRGENQ